MSFETPDPARDEDTVCTDPRCACQQLKHLEEMERIEQEIFPDSHPRSEVVVNLFVVHCKRQPFDVYIGRPSKWGNPFSHKDGTLAQFKVKTRAEAVESYAEWILSQPHLMAALPELRGKVLGCWCAPLSCHGDILAALAN